MNPRECIRRAKFDLLYAGVREPLTAYCVMRGSTPSDAEDSVQEVALRAWKFFDRYDPDRGTFYSWMLKMLRNRAWDKTRAGKVEDITGLDYRTTRGQDCSCQIDQALSANSLADRLAEPVPDDTVGEAVLSDFLATLSIGEQLVAETMLSDPGMSILTCVEILKLGRGAVTGAVTRIRTKWARYFTVVER